MTSKMRAAAVRAFVASCALADTGCVLPDLDDMPEEEPGSDGSDDAAKDDDSDADSGSESTGDPTAEDDESGTGGSDDDDGSDSGPGGSTLDDDVLFFTKDLDPSGQALWAYDVGTDQAHQVTALDGMSEIRSIAIHPGRTGLAIASTYGVGDYQASEAIYGFDFDDTLTFGEPTLVMQPIPAPANASSGYYQRLGNLAFHPDGSRLWFSHSFQFSAGNPGGGTIGSLDLVGGDYALYIDSVGDCTVNTGPSPSLDGTVLLGVRGVCIDGTHDGLVAFDVPPQGEPQVIVPTSNMVLASPRWTAGGAGIVYAAGIDFDADGDGTTDVYGDALVLLDITAGEQYALLPPTAGNRIWNFAISPGGDRFVACVSHDGPRDLLLVDLSGNEPQARWLTDDGVSCDPAW